MPILIFTVQFELSAQFEITQSINRQVFPLLNQATRAITNAFERKWIEGVTNAKLWEGEKEAYIKTIKSEMTGDFTSRVWSDYKYAKDIETGRPPRDLKLMLNTSDKVRRTESGKRFLVIPMRHNVDKLKAAGLYGIAKALEASRVEDKTTRPSGEVTYLHPKEGMRPSAMQSQYLYSAQTQEHAEVNRNIYGWGGALTSKEVGEHKWAAGLYRFDTSSGKSKSSEYLTFRIMMEGQKGWIVPAQPGQYIVKKVEDEMKPKAELVYQEAMRRELKQ